MLIVSNSTAGAAECKCMIYMPCTAENNFTPELPKETPDLIYLCFPNNPTGAMVSKAELQKWVDYANKVGAILLYDAAYEAYISEKDIPHSIYECEGARTCAIEMRSFSKNAGFTGMRLGFTVIPKDIKSGDVTLHSLWARRHGTKYNGAPYIIQRAGEAVYSPEGKAQLKEQVAYYMKNAKVIYDGLKGAGYTVSGGVNAPYIWLKTTVVDDYQFFTLRVISTFRIQVIRHIAAGGAFSTGITDQLVQHSGIPQVHLEGRHPPRSASRYRS